MHLSFYSAISSFEAAHFSFASDKSSLTGPISVFMATSWSFTAFGVAFQFLQEEPGQDVAVPSQCEGRRRPGS